jgi:anti-sigma-K factor RskA
MMDMMRESKNINYQKKITSYIDGSISADERAEFEAFVRTNPELENQLKKKEEEINLIKSFIPVAQITKENLEALEGEMKVSVFNLLKDEPKGLVDRLRNSWEDFINR